MKVRYLNQQDKADPMNGAVIAESKKLAELLSSRQGDAPFVAELRGDNGFELVLGIGPDIGFVEHRRIDGCLPYLVAAPAYPRIRSGNVEFLTADTPTPIPARYILNFDELKQIALHFLETGERSDAFSWNSI